MQLKNDSESQTNQDDHTKGIIRWVFTAVIYLIIMSASLFLSAGTLDWSLAWIFIGVATAIVVLDALVLIPISPDLLGERSRYQEGAKIWDQFLSRWMATFGPLIIWIVSGLDFRNSWSGKLPSWVIVVSIGLFFVGWVLGILFIISGLDVILRKPLMGILAIIIGGALIRAWFRRNKPSPPKFLKPKP